MFPLTNYIILFIILMVVGFLYRRYEDKLMREENIDNYDAIRKYLLNDTEDLATSKKPIMWIHIPYEYNSRNWISFGSRSSFELNQPYLYLTVKSILERCGDSFHICLIDDASFEKLIPDWKIHIDKIGNPISCKIREMAITKLIYMYGGMRVPISFLCFRDLISMYEKGTRNEKMFVCENIDKNITSTSYKYYPDITFMGAPKECPVVGELIDFMQRIISTDFTAQSEFLGDFDRWVDSKVRSSKVNIIDGMEIGVKDMDEMPIMMEHLLGQDYIKLYDNAYGIYIPAKDILNRVSYEWFPRMSVEQVLEGDTILSKYMILATAPKTKGKEGFQEGLGRIEEDRKTNRPDWVGFWKTPLQASWQIKPNYLGNNLIKLDAPKY